MSETIISLCVCQIIDRRKCDVMHTNHLAHWQESNQCTILFISNVCCCVKSFCVKRILMCLQDFAKNKAIPPGEDQTVYFPPVWNWSQQFSTKDQTLFNNPMYVGKGAACVQNGEVKTFRRTKVRRLSCSFLWPVV